jgi:chromosome segregation ATPase
MGERFVEGVKKSDGHAGDKAIEGMIEMVTPEADEDARKVQREAVKFLLDPNQQRSQQHFDNMIKGVTGQAEGDSSDANPESRPDDRVQRQATRTSGLGPAYDNAKAQLLQAQQEYTTAQTVYQPNSRGLREAAGKLAQARRALADVASATLGNVQKQLADMKEEYDVYLTEMKPEHPKMQDLSAKIDAGNKAVRQLRADIAQGLEPIYVCNIDERKRIDSEFREDSKPGDGTGKKHTFTVARGMTAAEARSRAGAVAPPTTQRSGTPGAAKHGA